MLQEGRVVVAAPLAEPTGAGHGLYRLGEPAVLADVDDPQPGTQASREVDGHAGGGQPPSESSTPSRMRLIMIISSLSPSARPRGHGPPQARVVGLPQLVQGQLQLD